jgi:hypothetical protein
LGRFNYYLRKAFPSIIDEESVFRGLNYIYGCHPGSNISLVSVLVEVQGDCMRKQSRIFPLSWGVVPGVLI